MSGWMYRFNDGPAGGSDYGPLPLDPPEDIIVWKDGNGDFQMTIYDEDVMGYGLGAGVTRYRRVKMSKLDADDSMVTSGLMIRGAEFEMVT